MRGWIVAVTREDGTDTWAVFESRESAEAVYRSMTQGKGIYAAALTQIIKSTDYEGTEDR